MKQVKHYHYQITTLSPIHIGTGNSYEPTNSVIVTQEQTTSACPQTTVLRCPECGGKIINGECSICGEPYESEGNQENSNNRGVENVAVQNGYLYTFKPHHIKKALSPVEQQTLYRLSQQNSWSEIRKFFIQHKQQLAQYGFKKAIVSKELSAKYNQLETGTLFNIDEQICDMLTQNPIIPGSSIKGAMRTAVLNCYRANANRAMNRQIGGQTDYNAGKNDAPLQQAILNYTNIPNDPFKNLKISDAVSDEQITTHIVYQINQSKRSGIASGLRTIAEVIPQGAVFKGTLIVTEESQTRFGYNINNMAPRIDAKTVIDSCNTFYQNEYQKETEYVKTDEESLRYRQMFKAEGSHRALIRIGKHSGGDCVTIEGFRRFPNKNKDKNNRTKPLFPKTTPSTVWLAKEDGLIQPFGWAIIEIKEENQSK